MFSRGSFFILALLSSPHGVWGQELLSFDECVRLAKTNNAEVRSSEESVNGKNYLINSFRGSYFPQISGNLGYQHSGPSDLVSGAAGASYSASLSASQNLFNGFADSAKVEQAKEEARVARANLLLTKAKVSYDLKAAFANLLYAQETEKITQDFQKRREDNLRMVELRYENGRENKGSLLLSRAYLAQAKVDVLKAGHAREISQSDLRKVLGWDDERTLNIKPDLPLQDPLNSPIDYRKIASATPVRLQAEAQVGVAQASVSGARSGFYPSLNLTGSLGKADAQFFPEKDRWSVGATLSWPLFGGGKDYYSTKSATSGLYSAKSNLSSTERQLISTLKKAHLGFIEAVEDLKVSEAFLLASVSRAEIARAKYNNGLMTFDEWDIIENDLINKAKTHLQAKRDRILAEATWEQAQGTGVIP